MRELVVPGKGVVGGQDSLLPLLAADPHPNVRRLNVNGIQALFRKVNGIQALSKLVNGIQALFKLVDRIQALFKTVKRDSGPIQTSKRDSGPIQTSYGPNQPYYERTAPSCAPPVNMSLITSANNESLMTLSKPQLKARGTKGFITWIMETSFAPSPIASVIIPCRLSSTLNSITFYNDSALIYKALVQKL